MRKDLKQLLSEAGKKVRKSKALVPDFEHYSQFFRMHEVNLSSKSVKKLWAMAKGKHHLSAEALNRIALFAGFQSWDDLQGTFKGETDASVNFRD